MYLLEENMKGFQVFHTSRDYAVCQPLLFPTTKMRHRAITNLQCVAVKQFLTSQQ